MKKFEFWKKKIENNNLEGVWWPTLPSSYYISPFSYSWELNSLRKDLENYNENKILIDLEPPLLNKRLFFRNFFLLFQNKKTIQEIFTFLNEKDVEIFIAESIEKTWVNWLREISGFSYSLEKFNHRKILLYYSSMFSKKQISYRKNLIEKLQGKYGDRIQVGLGTIAPGVERNPRVLLLEKLEEDLALCKNLGIKEVTIFRLGGINEQYLNIIKKFI